MVVAVVSDHHDDISCIGFFINRVVEVGDGVTNADTSVRRILDDDDDTTMIVVAAAVAAFINGIFLIDDDRVLFFMFLL